MSIYLKDTTANAALDKITTDAASTPYIQIWTSAAAPSGHVFAAAGGTLLATLAMTNPIGPGSANGVLTLSAITSATAGNTGSPGAFRICSATGDTDGTHVIMQGDCGVGSGSLNFSSTIASGGTVSITTGMTITNPNAA